MIQKACILAVNEVIQVVFRHNGGIRTATGYCFCAKQDPVVAWETARSRNGCYVDLKKVKISRMRNNVVIELQRCVQKLCFNVSEYGGTAYLVVCKGKRV